MSLQEEVLAAAGGARWSKLRRFTSHLMLEGSLVAPLTRPHSLKEIVAEGDIARRSVRISGFSEAGGAWGFNPDFVTIRRDDGGYVGARREAAPRPFQHPKGEAERVYLCGLSIWNCMTAPLILLGGGAQTEDLGDWPEHGEVWRRLRVTAPEGSLAYSRELVMYFGPDRQLRRTDFEVFCGEPLALADYTSAYVSFSGLTLPTLHRMVRRPGTGGTDRRPLLDIEIFDATFD